MRPTPLVTVLLGALLFSSSAFAADKSKKDKKAEEDEVPTGEALDVDENDFKEAGGDDDTPPAERPKDDGPAEVEGDELDFSDDGDDKDDLQFTEDDEQQSVRPRGPGEDTAKLYRDAQRRCKDMTPDEEQLVWEEYLAKYPKSLFRDRIEAHMEELSAIMFGERVPGSDKGAGNVDAKDRELNFALPFGLSPADPRSHVSGGIQWGFPSWFGGKLDFEYAFMRQFSAHALLGRDFGGGVVQPGAKYAIIKSSRTGTLLTAGVDLKLNMSPTFLAVRPIVSFGQRFRVAKGLDIMGQMAVDIETREYSDLRYNWGLAANLAANETVSVFWEWSWDAKYLSHPDVPDSFLFFTTTFGLKFTALKSTDPQGDGRLDAGVGGVFPYATNYWGFYPGGVDLLVDYYL
jgi:hypothetical protein